MAWIRQVISLPLSDNNKTSSHCGCLLVGTVSEGCTVASDRSSTGEQVDCRGYKRLQAPVTPVITTLDGTPVNNSQASTCSGGLYVHNNTRVSDKLLITNRSRVLQLDTNDHRREKDNTVGTVPVRHTTETADKGQL